MPRPQLKNLGLELGTSRVCDHLVDLQNGMFLVFGHVDFSQSVYNLWCF